MLVIKIERSDKMHEWGDQWFKEHGDHLYSAIDALEKRIRKWALMPVCGKEKYGTYRDEFLSFWDGSIGSLFCGYRIWWGANWWTKLWFKLDHYLIPYRKSQFGWLRGGIADFNRLIGLVRLVNWWQARRLNKAFQVTCKEYPDVIDELVMDTDCYRCIKPCRWGDVDGEAIHRKYWIPLKPKTETVTFECSGVTCTAQVEVEQDDETN